MFIQTEATPNPATLKFLPGKVVMQTGTAEFRDARKRECITARRPHLRDSPASPASFFGYDFVTVSKDGPNGST